MSTDVSNLYAMRAYAENTLALWPADDNLSFISLLSASGKSIHSWTFSGASAYASTSSSVVFDIPMPDEILSSFRKANSGSATVTATSHPIYISDLDSNKNTITINANLWKASSLPERYKIGFLYNSNGSLISDTKQSLVTISFTNWQQVSHSMTIPSSASVIYGYLEVEYFDSSFGPDYDIYVNGLSIGQWSNAYASNTTGVYSSPISSSAEFYTLLPSSSVQLNYVELDAYGVNVEDNGYYILEGKRMLAYNGGMPMVYGSSNITKLYPSIQPSIPSIIFPGKGFFNTTGKYKQLTAEFWLRVNNKSNTPLKIFGPLATTDGLYVEEEYLTLRLDRHSYSHFVGKWFRPMLIDIRYSPSNVSMLINGDKVLDFDIVADDLTLPSTTKDWIGFFAHNDTQPMEVDCIAIYPYIVPEVLAKRKFVYGQGVESPDIVASQFNADNAYIDFAFAKYSSNIIFPDQRKWTTGYFFNLDSTTRYISLPDYDLPELKIYGEDLSIFNLTNEPRTWDEVSAQTWSYWNSVASWEELSVKTSADIFLDNYFAQNQIPADDPRTFITMRPNPTAYANIHPTIYFNNLSVTRKPTISLLGVFRNSASVSSSAQVLMRINSKNNTKNFSIDMTSSSVNYKFYNGTSTTILKTSVLQSSSAAFIAGINIPEISNNYRAFLNDFFDNLQNLSLNVCGYDTQTYTGKMYALTFNSSELTARNDFNYFDSNGFASLNSGSVISISDNDNIFDYIGNYTLLPFKTAKSVELDIAAQGYWESHIPLSYLGKFVTDRSGNSYYDLDTIQFNIDYPSSITKTGSLMSNVNNNSDVKIYTTLQNSSEVGTIPYSNWISASTIANNRVIDFDNTIDVLSSKYELIDGTIIFPPKELIDFNDYYLGLHIEMKTKSIKRKPIKLQKMSLTSLAYDESSFYSIKTKTGMSLYPFTRYGDLYSFKAKNPFVIGRESMPYLYMTSDSGISVLNYSDNDAVRGISIPINQQLSNKYNLGGIQFFCMYNYDELISGERIVARLNTNERPAYFKIIPESNGKRASLKLFHANTDLEYTGATFYQNGLIVDSISIEPMCWNSIVVSFGQSYAFSNTLGQFELLEGMIFNNISFFQKLSDVLFSSAYENKWTQILFSPSASIQYWNQFDNEYTWSTALNAEQASLYSIPGNLVFNSYLGISNIVNRDSSTLTIDYEKSRLLMNTSWSIFSGTPA